MSVGNERVSIIQLLISFLPMIVDLSVSNQMRFGFDRVVARQPKNGSLGKQARGLLCESEWNYMMSQPMDIILPSHVSRSVSCSMQVAWVATIAASPPGKGNGKQSMNFFLC